ncbi:MAG: 6-phosphogluconolactonase [Lentisphaerae bacterium GWF2_52_8]|nr:MAG: 6-phosphogluconolactonase [Lentisphaerae bacterium GWF2_52_8]
MPPVKRHFKTSDELAEASAEAVHALAKESQAARGRFSIAISGGQSPKGLFAQLASKRWSNAICWDKTDIFWVDERCVPLGSPDSNEGTAREILLSKIAIPSSNIHAMQTSMHAPEQAALEYENTLRNFFGENTPFPQFDLILLGMGADGHTASLFPRDKALDEEVRWVLPIQNPPGSASPCVPRLTLTLPVLNSARNIIFIVVGKEKITLAENIIAGSPETASLPAALLRPNGNVSWHLSLA